MLQMRARGFALRDAFPDVLKGLITSEEAQDFPDEARPAKDITPAKPRNPLDAITMSEITQDTEQNDPQQEYVQVEQVNQQLQEEAASHTEVEVKEYTWALGVPGKPDIPCEDYETWARKYEELADKVAKAGNATPETRIKKLQELRNANQVMFSRLQPEESLIHTKALVKRRTELGAE
jgi:hypothetical protein